jgi:hypothetical protein
MYITNEKGKMNEAEFNESMREGLHLKIFAIVYFYPQYKFEKFAPKALKMRFWAYYKKIFEQIYPGIKPEIDITSKHPLRIEYERELQTAMAVPPQKDTVI